MALQDKMHSYGALTLESPAQRAFEITPDDTTDLPTWARALWVGGAGTVRVLLWQDTVPVALVGVPSGSLLPISVRRVLATGTTATAIVGLL